MAAEIGNQQQNGAPPTQPQEAVAVATATPEQQPSPAMPQQEVPVAAAPQQLSKEQQQQPSTGAPSSSVEATNQGQISATPPQQPQVYFKANDNNNNPLNQVQVASNPAAGQVYVNMNNNNIEKSSFNDKSKEYYCCCNGLHIKTGTIIIGGIQLALHFILYLVHIIISCTSESGFGPIFASHSVIVIIMVVIYILFFIGIWTQNGYLFIPWQIINVFEILGFCGGFSYLMLQAFNWNSAYAYSSYSPYHYRDDDGLVKDAALFGIELSAILLGLSLMVWWMVVVFKCQKYFSDKNKSRA